MDLLLGFECLGCGRQHRPAQAKYGCPACGANLQASYDYAKAKRLFSRKRLAAEPRRDLWRYLPLLPVRDAGLARRVQVGWTPLYDAERLARSLGLKRLLLKDDGRNASASFKDRASAVVLAHAAQTRQKIVATASTGNAASSLACLAPGSGLRSVIFVPKAAPAPKLAQLLVFGATVLAVDGTYDDAFELCAKACERWGWYNRSTGLNPYTREGKKTCAFELCEQLGWDVPDEVYVPVGDGNILSGLWKGFTELRLLELIDRLPRLVAVQAQGSAAIARAVQ
ncbi:MAG: pyridoxal-phosphate dependent enzyme, partial [Elusimicrobia bacterium]|nr:pyridoxal-phosphate dependent enzyme [Elusimicrobiota bacterium]